MDTKVFMKFFVLLFCSFSWAQNEVEGDRNLRIVGGSLARGAQFPHAVALIVHLPEQHTSFCGGSIIHERFILTAAHCLDDATRIDVQAGLTRIFRETPQYRTSVDPRLTRQHERYNRDTLANDIGLIQVLHRIPLARGSAMNRITLPSRAQRSNRFVGSVGTVIGWGRFSDESESLSNELRFVQLPIIREELCVTTYNSDYNYFMTSSHICLSGQRGSTCNGDSGGAMHLTLNGQMTVIGIVSYGSSLCENGHPPVMTRVTNYLDWISTHTQIPIAQS